MSTSLLLLAALLGGALCSAARRCAAKDSYAGTKPDESATAAPPCVRIVSAEVRSAKSAVAGRCTSSAAALEDLAVGDIVVL